jgi:hypothetical protein
LVLGVFNLLLIQELLAPVLIGLQA